MKKICIAQYDLLVTLKSPSLTWTWSRGATEGFLSERRENVFSPPVSAHQALRLPDFTCLTLVTCQRHWYPSRSAVPACPWPHASQGWLLFSFSGEAMEAGWHWWSWAQARLPVQHSPPAPLGLPPTPSPPTPQIMLQRWVIPTRALGRIAKQSWRRANRLGWALPPYHLQEGQAYQSQGHRLPLCPQTLSAWCVKMGSRLKIFRPFNARIPFLQISVKE